MSPKIEILRVQNIEFFIFYFFYTNVTRSLIKEQLTQLGAPSGYSVNPLRHPREGHRGNGLDVGVGIDATHNGRCDISYDVTMHPYVFRMDENSDMSLVTAISVSTLRTPTRPIKKRHHIRK